MAQKLLFVEQRPRPEGKVGNAVESRRLNSHSQRFVSVKARAGSLAGARRETLHTRSLPGSAALEQKSCAGSTSVICHSFRSAC